MNQQFALPALELRGLTKTFERPAVDQLDLTVRRGEFYGLLGPNGAGKTTTLRMVAGLLAPEQGSISVFGIDALADPVEAKRIMAWVSDEPMIYDKLTPYEYLEFVAGLWSIEPGIAEPRANELLGWLGLAPNAHQRCEGFSKGMRQKVALAGALVHDPRLIILDEPLTGLDAGSARQVKNVLRERVAAGGTVIMTTHILEVAERMADRIGVIAGGRLIAEGTLDELRRKAGKGDQSLEDTFLTLVAEQAESGVIQTASLAWLGHHELRLAWRDWWSMLTAGKAHRARAVVLAILAFAAVMHLVAFSIVARFADVEPDADRGTLVVITGCALLGWSLMMSQAMESVTRAFYARSDLDLILSSPVNSRRVFAVRIATMAASTVVMAVLLAAPFINILVWRGGAHWISAYGVVVAVGSIAAAMSVALTVALFRAIGPKRTRLAAQIVAAVVGATFVIGLQVAAILSYGTLSYFTFLNSDILVSLVPAVDSIVWWPARAILGDFVALAAVLATGFLLLAGAIVLFSARFGDFVLAAASLSGDSVLQSRRRHGFRRVSQRSALRHKEWTLLLRDRWLASQTLMQLLYLLPPGLMLWRAFGGHDDDMVLLVPVLVMGAGQLAGGLAWLAISGEDAPDLVSTAPLPASWIIRAKIEAVTGGVALVFAPFIIAMALASPRGALIAAAGVGVSAASATMIQLWFRTQAKRKYFRRRQTSSRLATFSEAFSSISWAGTAGLAAAGHWQAAITGLIAIGILAATQAASPKKA